MRSIAALGLAATVAGCGNDDAAVFGDATIASVPDDTAAPSPTTPPTTIPVVDQPSTNSPTTSAPTTSPASTTTDVPAGPSAARAFPDGGELVVDFTFAPISSGERIRNPYIAVWIEDLDGNLVDTVSLWWQESGRGGPRWLRTLRQWSEVTGEAVDPTASGATRPAGTYSVGWDGLDADGQPIAPGAYRLLVEAAREDGPYEITTADVVFDGATFEIALPDDGELIDVAARLIA